MPEFKRFLQSLWTAVLSRSDELSLGLGLSVLVLFVGVVIMLLAIFRRNQLDSEILMYSSIGSLIKRRHKHEDKLSETSTIVHGKHQRTNNVEEPNNDVTTTMEVSFFPRYSLVKKSHKGDLTVLAEKGCKEKRKSKSFMEEKEEKKNLAPPNPVKDIFSSLSFNTRWEPEKVEEDGKRINTRLNRSFYHENTSHSKTAPDLTGVEMETHQNIRDHSPGQYLQLDFEPENESSDSPQPLLPEENMYSLGDLQQRWRQMISGYKQYF